MKSCDHVKIEGGHRGIMSYDVYNVRLFVDDDISMSLMWAFKNVDAVIE